MSTDFWEKLILASAGPVVTAVLGTFILGGFLGWITKQAQDRRAANEEREERLRVQHQLRVQLISEMAEAAGALYMATQRFWRKKERENVAKDELDRCRAELDAYYRDARIKGEVIERKLEAYFSSVEPKALWHASMDLLTVRYFHLIGLATDELLRVNAGEEHTGLTVDQLRDQGLVLKTYREKSREASEAVLAGIIKPMAG